MDKRTKKRTGIHEHSLLLNYHHKSEYENISMTGTLKKLKYHLLKVLG